MRRKSYLVISVSLCTAFLLISGQYTFGKSISGSAYAAQVDVDIESWIRRLEFLGLILMMLAGMTMFWISRLQSYLKNSAAQLRLRNDELEKSAEDLEESEKRFRELFECSPDAIFVEDFEGKVLDVNPAACKIHNRTRSELISKTVFEMVPSSLHPAVELRMEQWRMGNFISVESVTLGAEGRRVPVEIRASAIEYFGQKAFLLHVRDISKRANAIEDLRRAKEFSESLIRTANILIIGLNPHGTFEIFNEAAERATGYYKGELLGKEGWELLMPRDRYPDVWNEFHRLTAGSEVRGLETPILTKSGKERIISWQSSHIQENGEPGSSLVTFGVDITERKQEESKREALERKMLDTQKLESLGVLAGGIAHDFNNLLTAILGNATLARTETGNDSEVDKYLDEIERTSIQAADLCKQMLAYSGKGIFETSLFDLNHTVEEMKHLLQISVTKKVGLEYLLSKSPLIVHGDVAQIRQVILNLVINGSEAIDDEEGGIRIKTSMKRLTREILENNQFGNGLAAGKYAAIEVQDSGCGMSPETKARMFDPFFTTKFTGRGLGLAAVHGIIRGHRGLIDIDSDEGIGTTFTIYLPCAEVGIPAENDALMAPVNSKWQGEGFVLVIDDEEAVRLVTERALTTLGFTVLAAADGRDGVKKFREHSAKIVAVVLDMTMPHLGGKETFPLIRDIRSDVPVLFTSGYTKGKETHAFDSTTDFLQKPFQFRHLREKIRGLVEGNASCG